MKRAMAIGAHPDDIEFMMAGTLMLLGRAGYEIHYMNLANGSCGSAEMDAGTTIRVRRQEAMQACQGVSAVFHESLVNDIEIYYERTTLARLGAVLREVAPHIVLTHSPQDYMEDHMNTARLVVTAVFCRGMPNFPVEPYRVPAEGEVTLYHAQPYGNRDGLNELVTPALFVDVGSVMAQKETMLACHKSQKEWLDKSQGLDSYLETMRQLMRETGHMSGHFEYAEGWRRRNPLGFCAADSNPILSDLGSEFTCFPSAE
jgi:N-acetylglucosamine malate deacetylase 1